MKSYYQPIGGDWALFIDGDKTKTWDPLVELANDDGASNDESAEPSTTDKNQDGMQDGHIYDIDFPGIPFDNPFGYQQVQQKFNAIDFVRVEIDSGQKVSGNGWLYSRGSDAYPWHSEVWVVKDANGNLVRNPDGSGGPSLHNELGAGDNLDLGYPF